MNFPKKKYIFPNQLHNCKRILKGKNGKKCKTGVGIFYCGGGFINLILRGGLLILYKYYLFFINIILNNIF